LKAAEKIGVKNATEYAESKGFTSLKDYRIAKLLNIQDGQEYSKYLINKKEAEELEAKKSSQPNFILNYKPIGSIYTKESGHCKSEPSNVNMTSGYFHCISLDNQNYSFNSKGVVTAVWLGVDVTSIPQEDVLKLLSNKYGPSVTSVSGEKFIDRTPNKIVAFSFGCKAYLFNQPSMDLRYDSPNYSSRKNEMKNILEETGFVFDGVFIIYNSLMNFEILKEEVTDISKCIVGSITTFPIGTPTKLGEVQEYKSMLRVLEVDPKFPLLRSINWAK
jgi:hypothetical protein